MCIVRPAPIPLLDPIPLLEAVMIDVDGLWLPAGFEKGRETRLGEVDTKTATGDVGGTR